MHDCAGNHQPLALSSGEPPAAFADYGVHAHGHGFNVLVESGTASRGPRIGDGQGRCADDVGENIAIEDFPVLHHYSHLPAQSLGIDICQIHSVEVDRTRFGRLKTKQQPEQRGLARSGMADERDKLSRLDLNRDVIENQRKIGFVTKQNPAAFDGAVKASRVEATGSLRFRNCFQDRLGSLVCGDDANHRDRGHREAQRRSEELPKSGIERHESAGSEPCSAFHHVPAEIEDCDSRNGRKYATEDGHRDGNPRGPVRDRLLFGEFLSPARERLRLGTRHPELCDPRHQIQREP